MNDVVGAAFDEWAGMYDAHYSEKIDLAEDRALGRLLSDFIHREDCLIDFGCGTGKVLDLLEDDPFGYIGIDLSPRMIEEAAQTHGLDRKSWLVGDMTDMIVNGGYATCVTSLYGSPSYAPFGAVAREAYRVLEPDGWCCLMPYALGRLDRKRPVQALSNVFTVDHLEAMRAMYDAGFVCVDVQGFSSARLDRLARWLPQSWLDARFVRHLHGEAIARPDDCAFLLVTGIKP